MTTMLLATMMPMAAPPAQRGRCAAMLLLLLQSVAGSRGCSIFAGDACNIDCAAGICVEYGLANSSQVHSPSCDCVAPDKSPVAGVDFERACSATYNALRFAGICVGGFFHAIDDEEAPPFGGGVKEVPCDDGDGVFVGIAGLGKDSRDARALAQLHQSSAPSDSDGHMEPWVGLSIFAPALFRSGPLAAILRNDEGVITLEDVRSDSHLNARAWSPLTFHPDARLTLGDALWALDERFEEWFEERTRQRALRVSIAETDSTAQPGSSVWHCPAPSAGVVQMERASFSRIAARDPRGTSTKGWTYRDWDYLHPQEPLACSTRKDAKCVAQQELWHPERASAAIRRQLERRNLNGVQKVKPRACAVTVPDVPVAALFKEWDRDLSGTLNSGEFVKEFDFDRKQTVFVSPKFDEADSSCVGNAIIQKFGMGAGADKALTAGGLQDAAFPFGLNAAADCACTAPLHGAEKPEAQGCPKNPGKTQCEKCYGCFFAKNACSRQTPVPAGFTPGCANAITAPTLVDNIITWTIPNVDLSKCVNKTGTGNLTTQHVTMKVAYVGYPKGLFPWASRVEGSAGHSTFWKAAQVTSGASRGRYVDNQGQDANGYTRDSDGRPVWPSTNSRELNDEKRVPDFRFKQINPLMKTDDRAAYDEFFTTLTKEASVKKMKLIEAAPAYWGIRIKDFSKFIAACKTFPLWDKIKRREWPPPDLVPKWACKKYWDGSCLTDEQSQEEDNQFVNGYEIEAFFVRPWTARSGMGLSLNLHDWGPQGTTTPQNVDIFVSHAWGENMEEVDAMMKGLIVTGREYKAPYQPNSTTFKGGTEIATFSPETTFWFCIFANYQHGGAGLLNFQATGGSQKEFSLDAFAAVVERVNTMVAIQVRGRSNDMYTRIWCIFELWTAMRTNKRIEMVASKEYLKVAIAESYFEKVEALNGNKYLLPKQTFQHELFKIDAAAADVSFAPDKTDIYEMIFEEYYKNESTAAVKEHTCKEYRKNEIAPYQGPDGQTLTDCGRGKSEESKKHHEEFWKHFKNDSAFQPIDAQIRAMREIALSDALIAKCTAQGAGCGALFANLSLSEADIAEAMTGPASGSTVSALNYVKFARATCSSGPNRRRLERTGDGAERLRRERRRLKAEGRRLEAMRPEDVSDPRLLADWQDEDGEYGHHEGRRQLTLSNEERIRVANMGYYPCAQHSGDDCTNMLTTLFGVMKNGGVAGGATPTDSTSITQAQFESLKAKLKFEDPTHEEKKDCLLKGIYKELDDVPGDSGQLKMAEVIDEIVCVEHFSGEKKYKMQFYVDDVIECEIMQPQGVRDAEDRKQVAEIMSLELTYT